MFRNGYSLAIVGRRRDRLIETKDLCLRSHESNSRCHVVVADVTKPADVERIVSETVEHFGGVGALINNAALAKFSPIEEGDMASWNDLIQTNVLGPALLIKQAVPLLRESRGAIINISSIGGILSLPGRAIYGASKAALTHMTKSLARELAPIRVNAIVPGAIETEMYERLGYSSSQVSELKKQMIDTTPMGRMGTVDDIVPWVELLVSKAGEWVTGSSIVVDGGRSC